MTPRPPSPGPGPAGPRQVLASTVRDVRFAVRTLVRSPTFALMSALTVALAVGATTATYSVVRGVLLRPLPFPDSHRLVRIWEVTREGNHMSAAWPNVVDWREGVTSLDPVVGYSAFSASVLGGERPRRVRLAVVSRGFFRALGTPPARGRSFLPEEHQPGAEPVAVISHGFWRDELGAREALADLRFEARGSTFRVVGVAPPGFDFPDAVDIWISTELAPMGSDRTSHNYRVLARLTEGATLERAREEINAVTRGALDGRSGPFLAASVGVLPLRDDLVGPVRRPLLLLMGAAALLFLVACANLASAFFARALGRRRELAVRRSLGAGRGRLVRQLLTEAGLLALLGGAAGSLLAVGLVRGLTVVAPPGIPRLDAVGVDRVVLAFALGVSGAAALLFGLIPAVRGATADTGRVLRSGGRGTSQGGGRGPWPLLVGSEVALAVILVVGSGLLVRSFGEILSVDPGFRSRDVAAASLALPPSRYPDDPAMVRAYDEILGRVASLPGVESAGLVSHLPMSGRNPTGRTEIVGGAVEHLDDAAYRVASRGYFAALGIPLLRGRLFDEGDDASVPDVVVVNEAFAQRAWPGEDPLGKRMTAGGMDGYPDSARMRTADEGEWFPREATVVGVVGDVRHRGPTREVQPEYFLHVRQRPRRARWSTLVVRSGAGVGAVAASVRGTIREVAPDVPVDVGTMEGVVTASLSDRRFTVVVLTAFGLAALLLAGIGIYGVVSHAVERRTREVGIRIALGARPGDVRRLVQRDALGAAAVGGLVGVAGALGLSGVLRSLLFGVSAVDPPVYLAGAGALLAAAWLASWLPARRTTRIDPMRTIQSE